MSHGLFASLYDVGQPFALIDARERRDHVNGHWFGSTNIPLSVLSAQISRMIPDGSFPIFLLDWNDAASQAAVQLLRQLGYDNVTPCKTSRPDNFGGGFVQGEFVWSKAFGEVVAHTSGLPELTPADFLSEYQDAMLFDVRPTAEYSLFTIPGSQSLPNSLMLANMSALKNTGKMALLHCAGRTRSIIGACTLKAAGYSGPYAIFRGGTQAWQLDGHEREHDANRLFASETDMAGPIHDFLRKWNIAFDYVKGPELESFVATHRKEHLFDVSDDAATGQTMGHGIIQISGTNLIQQTDRRMARYHVPVILFDQGSGSRAAFAAYWLRAMGISARVVYLSEPLANDLHDNQRPDQYSGSYDLLSADQLLRYRDVSGTLLDFRPSRDFYNAHVKGSQWRNIGALLTGDQACRPKKDPIVIIGRDIEHGSETANLLSQYGWQIKGIFGWDIRAFDPEQIGPGEIESAVDESALFAGRHHGNMQDSRDYLAWEEDLPGQIDQELHQLWLQLLTRTPDA
ncbi:MAG: rhodanese-like domain-containing protein [Rhizobiaceae bacterium]